MRGLVGTFAALAILIILGRYLTESLGVWERHADERKSRLEAWRKRMSVHRKLPEPAPDALAKEKGAKLAPDAFHPIDPRD